MSNLEFDLSGSVRPNAIVSLDTPTHDFLLVFNSNKCLLAALFTRDIHSRSRAYILSDLYFDLSM